MNEEITNKLNYIDDELVKLQNAKAMKYLCNVESYIDYLEKENRKLKKQYCERTDCGGRLGNSKKVEELIKENEKLNHYKLLYQKVKDRNDKAIEYINIVAMATNKPQYFQKLKETIWGEELLEILKSNIEEVSNEIK